MKEHTNKKASFLNKSNETSFSEHHKKMLGYIMPNDYFQASKENILNAISDSEAKNKPVLWFKPFYNYSIAASILLFLGFSLWFQYQLNRNVEPQNEINLVENSELELKDDEFLIQSLLVEDKDINDFTEDFLVENFVAENRDNTSQVEDVFINSLMVNDSMIDQFINEKIEEIIFL